MFLDLIPKEKGAETLDNYRSISLCKTLYKVISKIIAERINKVLSRFISPEQASFLKDKSIHNAVATTQEVIHSIHSKKMKAMVLKLDLSKAYDRVDWGLLRLILLNIRLDRASVKWIMGCVNSTMMAIIINGVATSFFKPGFRLR